MTEDVTPSPRRKGRSPAYPAISLDRAIQRVRQVYDSERTYSVPVSSVVSKWGYSSLNGPASLSVSALKKFGLFDDEGNKAARTVAVTDLAVTILEHPEPDARRAAIRKAALLPPIHMEMWDQYGTSLPSDETLTWRLTRERGFTQTGAREFIREWRETLAFAQLDDSATGTGADVSAPEAFPEPGPPSVAGAAPDARTPQPEALLGAWPAASTVERPASTGQQPEQERHAAPSQAVQSYPIPIALHGRPPVIVSGAFPLSEAEWQQFKVVLDAMKPVLVGNPTTSADPVEVSGPGA